MWCWAGLGADKLLALLSQVFSRVWILVLNFTYLAYSYKLLHEGMQIRNFLYIDRKVSKSVQTPAHFTVFLI